MGTPGKPVIGVCAALEQARWRTWSGGAHLLAQEYAQSIAQAGGIPVLLPPIDAEQGDVRRLVSLLDALILAGGVDIDPASYGADAHPATGEVTPHRDAFELAILDCANERGLPVLGICRGMQLLNIWRGGTLTQHLPDAVGHGEHCRNPGSFDGSAHLVRLVDGSRVAAAARETEHLTLSHHHQAIERLGRNLVVTGTSMIDDVIEAIELDGAGYVVGVQWHPEADPASGVIGGLVAAAAAARTDAVDARTC
jgi:putative glutamine amidotransferase